MSVMHAARAIRLMLGIETEDDLHDLAPIGSFFCSVQKPQIGLEMSLVIGRDVRLIGGLVVEGGDNHRRTPDLVCMSDIRHSFFGLMMTVKQPFVDNLAVWGFQLLVARGSAGPIFR